MPIWAKGIPNIISTKGGSGLLFFLAILLNGLAGGLAAWFMRYFSGKEMFIFLALMGLWLLFFLSTVKFDFMVLITFCLFGLVRIEPAPIDGLVMLLVPVGLLTGKLSLKALTGSPLVHLALWIFLLVNLASLTATSAFFDSLRFLMITIYLVAFTYFIKMYITSMKAMRTVMIGYLISAIASTILIIPGYLGISPFADLFLQSGNRAVGTFKDPNVFGPFLIPPIILLVDEIFYPFFFPRFHWTKVFCVILWVGMVFLSFSRAAWGNLVLTVLVYLVLNARKVLTMRITSLLTGRISLFVLVTLMGAGAFVPLLNWMGLKKFFEWRTSSHTYDAVRFARQREGIEAGLSHLFGVGPGVWDHAHSLYARTLAEHGAFGLASLLLFMLILSISTFRQAWEETQKPYGLSAKVVMACLVGLLLNSGVIDTIHWRHFWFTFALAWVVSTPEGSVLPRNPG